MNIATFSANTWIYPDTVIENTNNSVTLHTALNAMSCFQILTDLVPDEQITFSAEWSGINAVTPRIYQLLPVCADRNSGKDVLTGPYEDVCEYATRRAPFYVFDAMREIYDGKLHAGRTAFFVRLETEKNCPVGERKIKLKLTCGEEKAYIDIKLSVHHAEIPPVKDAAFGMVNWLNIDEMKRQHGVCEKDNEFRRILNRYIDNQLDMRNTHLQIPSGVPVKDENGVIADFDFTLAETVGNAALERGFNFIMGGFVARFKVWNEKDQFLLWDRDVSVDSHEGYRQLRIYFKKACEVMKKNGWEGRYMQTLVDEPQFFNSDQYRILAGIARKYLPGIPIHDPVESTHLEGAIDIWDVKQAVFEKYIDEYRALQAQGEEMWLYTCGVPAGKMMNRVMDLPLTASILPMWMCCLYDCKGFLHWGYNVHTEKPFEITSYRPDASNEEISYPAGNAHIVYPGEYGPLWSVRAQLQRQGAEDAELIEILAGKNKVLSKEIIRSVCTDFSNYTFDGDKVDDARRAILEAIDG